MARQTNGTNQSLSSSSALSLGAPTKLAVSYWLYWDTFTNDDKFAFEYSTQWDTNAGSFINVPNHSVSTAYMVGETDAITVPQATFARPTANVWHHYLFNIDKALASGEIIDIYMDGASQGLTRPVDTNTADTFSNYVLYLMSRNNTSNWGAGRIAEVAIWGGVNLTGTDATNLTAGTLPTSIQAGSLKHYWKLCGTESPEPATVGSVAMTVNGATFASHPIAGSCTPITGLGRKFLLRAQ